MARFILVHGSNHGAWCWRDVVPLLEGLGHSVTAIDLPSHGEDATPIVDVSLDSYVQAVIDEIEKSDGPVVLLGHSAAGVTIASVAEKIPGRITRLIYLAAYAPKDGDSLSQMRKRAKRQLVIHAVELSEDRQSYTFDLAEAPKIFYHDCSDEVIAYALPRLGAQAIAPQATPVSLGENYESVPRSFIVASDDHTIPPEEQENIVADWPAKDVYRLDCGHSAFFVCPDTLVTLVDEIAKG